MRFDLKSSVHHLRVNQSDVFSPSLWSFSFETGVSHTSFPTDKKEEWSSWRRDWRSVITDVTGVKGQLADPLLFAASLTTVRVRCRSQRTSTRSCRMCVNTSTPVSPTSPVSWCLTPASKWPLTHTLMEELKVRSSCFCVVYNIWFDELRWSKQSESSTRNWASLTQPCLLLI